MAGFVLVAASAAVAADSRWVIQKTPNPVGAIGGSQLLGVSCPSAHACIAVGFFENNGDNAVAFAERWNGTKWSIQKLAKPGGAPFSGLSGVSCTSASACTAVGYYSTTAGAVTLVERWNGTKWAVQKSPTPAGGGGLDAVACTSARACTAVGGGGLAERWNGIKWVIEKTPNPAGLLLGVSCTSASACTAVGEYINSSSALVTLAERWNGTKWAIQKTQNPASASYSELFGVSCVSTGDCAAVGDFNRAGNLVGLVERWNGTKWAIQKTFTQGSALDAVSCTSARACTAVGNHGNSAGVTVTLVERWNGTKWAIQKSPNPAGAAESDLFGVSCTSASACTAVGDYFGSNQLTLAERHS